MNGRDCISEPFHTPTVVVAGDGASDFVSRLPADDRLRVEAADEDRALALVDSGSANCVVSADGSLGFLAEVREHDTEVPLVLVTDRGEYDEAIDADVTEVVESSTDRRGFARRLWRYANGHRLELSEMTLSSFLENTPHAVVVHDDRGKISGVNRRAVKKLGYSEDELLDMNVSDIEVGIETEVLEELWSEYSHNEPIVLQGRHRRKDGEEFPVEINLGRVGDGDRWFFVSITRDISEDTDASTGRLRKEYETVFDNSQDPTFLVEAVDDRENFVFRRLNPTYEENVGIPEEEMVGKTPQQVFGEEVGSELAENYRRCLERGETLSYEETLNVPVGERVYHTKISPVASEAGPEQVVVTARDITDRVERENELERYKAYVENTSDVITHLNKDGTILYHSPSVKKVLGIGQHDWVGDPATDYIHPEDKTMVAQKISSVVDDSESGSEEAEFRIQKEDGSYIWFESIAHDIRDTETGGVVVSSRDITERKEYEKELERYQKIIQNFSDIVTLLSDDGTVIYQSPSVESILGYGQDELIGENVFDYVHPDDEQETFQQFVSLLENPDNEVQDVEFRMQHKDGSYVWVEAVGADRRDTSLDAVVVNTRDITERKEREQELERNRELLSHTERISDTGGWEIDLEKGEHRWTDGARRIHGVSEDYQPTTLEDGIEFYHPDDREKMRAAIENCIENAEPFDREARLITTEDEVRWVHVTGEPVEEDGEVVKVRGVGQDITERKEREKKLQKQKDEIEERKEQMEFFNGLLRHDMLNSMTVIQGNAEILLEELPEDSESRQRAELIYSRSNDIADLTNRVRSVVERITGDDDRELSAVNLSETVEQRANSLREECNVDVTTDLPEDAYVLADEFLDDVVENLLFNTVEHNDKENLRVDIDIEAGPESTVLRVADNGSGVPDKLKKKVFQQGEKGRTSGSVGFGLYFVDSMVSEYGGEIWVEDNQPEGAVFVIELPNADGGFGGDRG
jgi:PAS domain S-box-containing protein